MAEGTARVEAFSDGVFAIAITLLILEIHAPEAGAAGGLWAGLLALWPSYVAFLLSFFVILVLWVNHHELMRLVRVVTYPLLFANGVLLLTVTFVPFPTAVLAQHLATPEAKVAVAFYCGTFVVNSLGWGLVFATMVRGAHAAAMSSQPAHVPIASPARYAAPSVVASVTGATSTGRCVASASDCTNVALAVIPPSTAM